MTSESDALCEDLRALLKSPTIGLPEYSADPVVQRRVGRMLAETSANIHALRAKDRRLERADPFLSPSR